jgi:hypothetical protein
MTEGYPGAHLDEIDGGIALETSMLGVDARK